MSRTKRSFWKVSLSVFANVSYETLILQGLFVRFCKCLARNAHFGRFRCPFLRMSRTNHSFTKSDDDPTGPVCLLVLQDTIAGPLGNETSQNERFVRNIRKTDKMRISYKTFAKTHKEISQDKLFVQDIRKKRRRDLPKRIFVRNIHRNRWRKFQNERFVRKKYLKLRAGVRNYGKTSPKYKKKFNWGPNYSLIKKWARACLRLVEKRLVAP